MAEKQLKVSPGPGGARKGAGRPKGSLDKGNAAIRDMIVQALDGVGGVKYLQKLAKTHPAAFASLIAKVMPTQVVGPGPGGEHKLSGRFQVVLVRPRDAA